MGAQIISRHSAASELILNNSNIIIFYNFGNPDEDIFYKKKETSTQYELKKGKVANFLKKNCFTRKQQNKYDFKISPAILTLC